MNLVVDIGNTLVKVAVYRRHVLQFFEKRPVDDFPELVREIFVQYPGIGQAIVSSVAQSPQREVAVLSVFCKVLELDHQLNVPFINKYQTPETLGVDRIALATAAYYHKPTGNILVIDAGTCITYDMVDAHGQYWGGGISPGLAMRYKAMHQQTKRLPLLGPEFPGDFIGTDTSTCMHAGAVYGMLDEVDGAIDRYRAKFNKLTVILTGGDAQFLSNRLKNSIFAHSKFLLDGLNYLLEYNKN